MPATTITRPTLTRSPYGWRLTMTGEAPVDFGSFVDAKMALRIVSSGGSLDDALFDVGYIDEGDGVQVCECEMDWNCPLHARRSGTWLETRYDGRDD